MSTQNNATTETSLPPIPDDSHPFSYTEFSDLDAPLDEKDLAVSFEGETSDELMSAYQALCSAIRGMPLLSAEQEREMAALVKAGDIETHRRFVLSNIRLVLACVKQVRRRLFGLPTLSEFMDLVQEGVLALCIAVDGYDPRWCTRFSTYAVPWIYPRLRRYYAQHRPGFSVSSNAGADSLCHSRYVLLYRDGKVDQIPEKMRRRVADLARVSSMVLAIESNSTMAEDPTTPYCIAEDKLKGDGGPGADEVVEERIFRETVRKSLEEFLSKEEADMCFRRFGIRPYAVPENLTQIAKAYGRSTESVRNTVDGALAGLRRNPKMRAMMFAWLRPSDERCADRPEIDDPDGLDDLDDLDALRDVEMTGDVRPLDRMSDEELWASLQDSLESDAT